MTEARATFAARSDRYAASRPRYPQVLFEWMVSECRQTDAAWDCATGTGQAAVDLAHYFNRVYGSDVSSEQVSHAERASNIYYSTQPAERTDYAADTFDLVAVAQALHWFDFDRFWKEVSRVAKNGALFCAWGYAWFETDDDVQTSIVGPFRAAIEPFWAPNNRLLWNGYRDAEIGFPYQRLSPPPAAIEVDWSIAQLVAYMETWSATKRARENPDHDQRLDRITSAALASLGGNRLVHVTMPLTILAGRVAK